MLFLRFLVEKKIKKKKKLQCYFFAVYTGEVGGIDDGIICKLLVVDDINWTSIFCADLNSDEDDIWAMKILNGLTK